MLVLKGANYSHMQRISSIRGNRGDYLLSRKLDFPDECPRCEHDFLPLQAHDLYEHWPDVIKVAWDLVGLPMSPVDPDWDRHVCCRLYLLASPGEKVMRVDTKQPYPVSPFLYPNEVNGYATHRTIRMLPLGRTEPTVAPEDVPAVLARMLVLTDIARDSLEPYEHDELEGIRNQVSDEQYPAGRLTQALRELYPDTYITNATTKVLELLGAIPDVIPDHVYDQSRMDVLYPAEYPGAMIVALIDIIYPTWRQPKLPHIRWFGSSYVPGGDTSALRASKNTPKKWGNWLMLEDRHSGDMTDPEVREKIQESVAQRSTFPLPIDAYPSYRSDAVRVVPDQPGVDLYIADGGMGIHGRVSYWDGATRPESGWDIRDDMWFEPTPAPSNKSTRAQSRAYYEKWEADHPEYMTQWNLREDINSALIIGEFELAWKTVRPGGTAIVKTYTMYGERTAAAFLEWAQHFGEVIMSKPMSSNQGSAEGYAVGTQRHPPGVVTPLHPGVLVQIAEYFHTDFMIPNIEARVARLASLQGMSGVERAADTTPIPDIADLLAYVLRT